MRKRGRPWKPGGGSDTELEHTVTWTSEGDVAAPRGGSSRCRAEGVVTAAEAAHSVFGTPASGAGKEAPATTCGWEGDVAEKARSDAEGTKSGCDAATSDSWEGATGRSTAVTSAGGGSAGCPATEPVAGGAGAVVWPDSVEDPGTARRGPEPAREEPEPDCTR